MLLTRDYKTTVRARIERDPGFREALLKEGVHCHLATDMETGKSVLGDYINATQCLDFQTSLMKRTKKKFK